MFQALSPEIIKACLICGMNIQLENIIVITENKREWNRITIHTL
jgi:hypothetical protein